MRPDVFVLHFIGKGALSWLSNYSADLILLRWGVLGDALQLMASKTVSISLRKKSFLAGYNFVSGKHELFPIPLDEIQVNYCLENKNNPNY